MLFTLSALICALAHGRSMAHCIGPFPLTAVLLLGGVLLAGCGDRAPTESASPAATPNFNFANGPAELSNVIRCVRGAPLDHGVDHPSRFRSRSAIQPSSDQTMD
jgi:hypothetical protein